MPKNTLTLKMSAGSHTLTGPRGTIDLSPYFTVTRDRQGLRWDRAGDYQRRVVNPTKEVLGVR